MQLGARIKEDRRGRTVLLEKVKEQVDRKIVHADSQRENQKKRRKPTESQVKSVAREGEKDDSGVSEPANNVVCNEDEKKTEMPRHEKIESNESWRWKATRRKEFEKDNEPTTLIQPPKVTSSGAEWQSKKGNRRARLKGIFRRRD